MKTSQNLKAGFIFLLFLVLLFWATIMVKGGLKGLFPHGRKLTARFDTVENLKASDAVFFAGVPVGKVTKIGFFPEFVEVEMLITEDGVTIYKGAEITVVDISMLGGKQVNISRGNPALGPIDWKDIQTGTAKPALSNAVEEVSRSMESTADTLTEFVKDNRRNLDKTVEELRKSAENIQAITNAIRDSKGAVGKIINEPDLYENINQAAANTNKLITSVVEGRGSIGPLFNRPEVYERLEYITRQMVQGRGVLGQMLTNEAFYNNLEGVVVNFERITRSLDEGRGTLGRLVNDPSLYDNLDEIVGRINRGEGTLGHLLVDEYLYQDIKDVVGSLKGISRSLESVTEKVDKGEGSVGKLVNDPGLYDKAEEAVEGARDVISAFKKFRTYVGMGAKYHGKQKLTVGRVYIRVDASPSKYFQVGGSWLGFEPGSHDVTFEGQFDGDRSDDIFFEPEILMGFRYFDNVLSLRLGLIEGQFGGGVDVDLDLPFLFDSQLRLSFEGRMAFADRDLDGTEIDEDVEPFVARFEASLFLLGRLRLFVGAHNFFDRIGFTGGVALEWHDDDIRNLVGLIGLAG